MDSGAVVVRGEGPSGVTAASSVANAAASRSGDSKMGLGVEAAAATGAVPILFKEVVEPSRLSSPEIVAVPES
jgi:hypothetical protein